MITVLIVIACVVYALCGIVMFTAGYERTAKDKRNGIGVWLILLPIIILFWPVLLAIGAGKVIAGHARD